MNTQTLNIPVLWPNYFEDCDQCAKRLVETLSAINGMHSVSLNGNGKTLVVTYDKSKLTFEQIKEQARLLGITLAQKYQHKSIRILGLDCPDCAGKLETNIKKINGVAWASLNYATAMLIVEYESSITSISDIQNKIKSLGYDIEIPTQIVGVKQKRPQQTLRLYLTAISGMFMMAAILTHAFSPYQTISSLFFLLSAISGGVFSFRTACFALKNLSMDTNVLMTLAALGAVAIGEYSEAAAVMFLFSVGSTLEAYTVEKTRKSISSLLTSFPENISVKINNEFVDMPLKDVETGTIILIKPGQKIPLDGCVVDGISSVNEAPVTGESIPKSKEKGCSVYAGTINGNGSLEIITTSTITDNTLARIVHLVEEAQAQKAPSQQFSETFGRYYTPIIIALALITVLFGPLIWGGGFLTWLNRSLTLLVVSCPCALVISTPVAIVSAIGNAAKSGILIKGGVHLETLGSITTIAFDKTGTLTEGKPFITKISTFNNLSSNFVLAAAAAMESRSEHPLAEAILNRARKQNIEFPRVSFFEAIPGKGAKAIVGDNLLYIGSLKLMNELSINIPTENEFTDISNDIASKIYISDETKLWGIIEASDKPKAHTKKAIEELKTAGIKKTIILTGDSKAAANIIAQELNIDEVFSELLPEDKLKHIKSLSSTNKPIAMVGDGINDAPALAAADIGIAMGGMGSHTAIEAADVALMADDIVMLPYAISLSRRAKKIIRQNVFFALTVVILLVIGALGKQVTLTIGVLGHEASALLVIMNSMKLLKNCKS